MASSFDLDKNTTTIFKKLDLECEEINTGVISFTNFYLSAAHQKEVTNYIRNDSIEKEKGVIFIKTSFSEEVKKNFK